MVQCGVGVGATLGPGPSRTTSSLDYSLVSYSFTSIHSYKDHLPKTCLGQKRDFGLPFPTLEFVSVNTVWNKRDLSLCLGFMVCSYNHPPSPMPATDRLCADGPAGFHGCEETGHPPYMSVHSPGSLDVPSHADDPRRPSPVLHLRK